jgi:hypothetical protein
MAEKKLTEEHLALLAEAEELGINTLGMDLPNSRLDTLRESIARRTAALAREAAAKQRAELVEIEAEREERESIRSAFDETMANTRGVLIRIVEWGEWLPIGQDEQEPLLTTANGVTGIEAGEKEKLLSVDVVGTQRIKHVEEEGLTRRFMLYGFKATLAQNVHTSLVTTLVEAQGSHQEGQTQRPPQPSPIITPNDGPNRAQRRHPHG